MKPQRIVRRGEVAAIVGLSRSTIYRQIKEKRFPAPFRIGAQAVGWHSDDIENWIEKTKNQVATD